MKRIKRENQLGKPSLNAVTSVLETLLLLSMTIGFFSILYLSVFTFSFSPLPPSVHILGTTSEDTIILYHRGGAALSTNSIIQLTIEGLRTNLTLGDYLDDTSKIDSQWNMGEQLVIPGFHVSGHQSEITIMNGVNNAVIFHGYV